MAEYINKWQAVANLMDARLKDTAKAVDAIQYMDASDVRPVVRGKWLQGNMPTYGGYKCSVCGGNTVHYKANFCPNCGADMRKEEGDGSEPFYSAEDAAQIIRLAPTIIPAEEE